ncbi:MAG: 4-hydroxybenzoate octaprenyltransferase [Xanthomonadales bacterium]|nr:4-hydroxybenzoate octaprenyltransferase [Xanthomonadales bacterium]
MLYLLTNPDKRGALIRLVRLDRPVGTYLVLWPTLWALWIAAGGVPRIDVLIIFVLGVIVMRMAGCVINDYADREFDGQVRRTRARPLATGEIHPSEALAVFLVLMMAALALVMLTNRLTVYYAVGGAVLAAVYPFMKRFTHLPQIVLGMAFAWAIPMAYTAQTGAVNPTTWLLFIATLLLTVAYDTMYAMVDRADDLKVGIKSTAILFGDMDRVAIAMMQGLMVFTLLLLGQREEFGLWYFLGVLAVAGFFLYQQWLIRSRERDACFRAFMNNQWLGLVFFLAIVVETAL